MGETGPSLGDSLLRFRKLGAGLSCNFGDRAVADNPGERDAAFLECCSSSLERNAVDRGLRPNGFILPVLKHGPRSLTYVRVCAWETYKRNESDRLDFSVLHNRPTSIFGERFE